jgi:hypothetical protein
MIPTYNSILFDWNVKHPIETEKHLVLWHKVHYATTKLATLQAYALLHYKQHDWCELLTYDRKRGQFNVESDQTSKTVLFIEMNEHYSPKDGRRRFQAYDGPMNMTIVLDVKP